METKFAGTHCPLDENLLNLTRLIFLCINWQDGTAFKQSIRCFAREVSRESSRTTFAAPSSSFAIRAKKCQSRGRITGPNGATANANCSNINKAAISSWLHVAQLFTGYRIVIRRFCQPYCRILRYSFKIPSDSFQDSGGFLWILRRFRGILMDSFEIKKIWSRFYYYLKFPWDSFNSSRTR